MPLGTHSTRVDLNKDSHFYATVPSMSLGLLLKQLNEERCRTVSPGWVFGNLFQKDGDENEKRHTTSSAFHVLNEPPNYLCSAHWTRPLSVEPCGDTLFAEYVFAMEHGGFFDGVVTYRADAAIQLQVLLAGTRAITLKQSVSLTSSIELLYPL